MSVRTVKAGTADVSVTLRIVDSTDGTPETGVAYNTSGIDLWFRREGEAVTSITEVDLAALTTAHDPGGFKHISHGWYRLDLPDAACATGVKGVQIGGTVTGMVVLAPYIELSAYDPYDTVRLGLTALPNAAADAAGGLPISDAGGLDLDGLNSNVSAILTDTGTTLDGKLDTIDGIVDAILLDTGTDGVVVAAASKTGYTLAATTGLGNQTANITGNLSGSVGSVTGAVGSVTGNVGGNVAGSVASVTAGVTLADDAITAAKFDESTAFPLKSADTGATAVARTGADSDTLETLSDEIAALTIPTAGAVADAVWDEAIAGHTGAGSTGEALAAAGSAGDPWTTALPGSYGSGTAGNIIGNRLAGTLAAGTHNAQSGDAFARLGAPAGASVSADVAAVKVETAAILDDTGTAGVVVAAGSKTGYSLTATTGLGNQTSNITGNLSGSVGSVTGAVGSVTGNVGGIAGTITTLDALDTAQDSQHATTQGSIAALNDVSSGDVQTAATAALNAYDPPTNAELVARTLASADYATASALGTVDTEIGLEAIKTAAIKAVTDALGATAAAKLAASATGIVTGAAASGTLSTTQMTTNLTEATDDHYNGRVIVWISGALTAQATDITDYDGATKMVIFTGTTEAPGAGDTFVIV